MRHEGQRISKIHHATHLFRTIASYSHFFETRIYMGDLEYGGKTYTNFVEALIPAECWEQQRKAL